MFLYIINTCCILDSLAAKVRRQDSLARFLNERPQRRELMERNIIPHKTMQEVRDTREYIGIRLNRYVNLCFELYYNGCLNFFKY